MLPLPLEQLAEQLRLLPGVGKKTALKYAFRVLELSDEQAQNLLATIAEVRSNIVSCVICHHISESDLCSICANTSRDDSQICVVEDARDVLAFERAGSFKGLYHVLGGVISPMDGIGPDKLNISSLLGRLDEVSEIIVATNPTVEGEATAMYLTKLLAPRGITVTRLAYGLPAGSDLEYADEVTLARAIEGRRSL